MSKEGFWLNSSNGKYAEIDEHAQWIINVKNAKHIGLSDHAYDKIKDKNWQSDRVEILMTAMADGLIRIRGHGSHITFEFTTSSNDALWAILVFLKKTGLAGPFSTLMFNNIRTKESIEERYSEFVEHMEEDPELILRRAKRANFNYNEDVINKIAKRLFISLNKNIHL